MRSKNQELMQAMLKYIEEVYAATGRTPSYREIGRKFNITGACVSNYIQEMKERDMLSVIGGSRGISTARMEKGKRSLQKPLKLVGSIACGTPMFAEENIDGYIYFPPEILGSGEFYALYAKGDSMINAGIDDGDLVIIRQQDYADEGQIIVALIDNEATLKRFYKDDKNRRIVLHPENDNYSDMYFEDIQVQGVAVKVLKDISC